MPETENIEQEQSQFGASDYIAQLEDVRRNTVSVTEYNRIAEDNKRLMNALADGERFSEQEESPAVDIDGIRSRLLSPDNHYKNNLAYFTDVLALRDTLIASGEQDPFLPFNSEYVPNEQDSNAAERIAQNLKECIEYADGDPRIFNVELQRRCGVSTKPKR